MHDLIAFQRDSLYIIAGLGDPRGLAIADELAEYYEKEIQPGRLYPNLDTLVTRGVESSKPVVSGKPSISSWNPPSEVAQVGSETIHRRDSASRIERSRRGHSLG